MAGLEIFKHGETVMFTGGLGTPSQRNRLWVVDLESYGRVQEDYGSDKVKVHRQADPDSIIWMPRKHLTAATLLDLIANL